MQLTPGEGHDRLRRVDSNRKSRSFSKQPSTGDYYKNLSTDSAEPRGSRGMAPNEEVTRQPNLSVAALCFTRVLTQVCDICEESDRFSCSAVSCSHAGCMTSHGWYGIFSCKLLISMASCIHALFGLQPRPSSTNQELQFAFCSGFTGVQLNGPWWTYCPIRSVGLLEKTGSFSATYLHWQQE